MSHKGSDQERSDATPQSSGEQNPTLRAPAYLSGADAELRHTLRTPLNHIIGYSELLLEEAGDEEERARTFEQLKWAGLLAVLLLFMVLAGTFESLVHPVTVLSAVPLALGGVAVALGIAGQPAFL